MKWPDTTGRGLTIRLCIPDERAFYTLVMPPGATHPRGMESAALHIDGIMMEAYPGYARECLRRRMKDDPLYAEYEKARLALAAAYPDCGVPTHVL